MQRTLWFLLLKAASLGVDAGFTWHGMMYNDQSFCPTMIDVGAHKGEVSLWLARTATCAQVWALEPHPVVADTLRAIAANLTNFHVVPAAAGLFDTPAPFRVAAHETMGSLSAFSSSIEQKYANCVEGACVMEREVMVNQTRMDTFMSTKGLTSIDLVKIDAQVFSKRAACPSPKTL